MPSAGRASAGTISAPGPLIALGGRLALANREGGGLEVYLHLPAASL
ncbi:MAG: hypothetical protein ABI660_18350 [Polaromonas sp.]